MKKKNIILVASCALLIGGGLFSCSKREDRGSLAPSAAELGLPADVGAVCGSESILGKPEESFSEGACGIENPVRVYAVGGIVLDQPAQINCKTAHALNSWVNGSARPNAARIDKELSGLKVAASYACRNRNHKKGGKLSEHAKGNAVDISGFRFTDGTELTVLSAYTKYKPYFQTVRKQACGPFGTVLGPGVALHDDHFHFDTASYSMGTYCK